MTRTIEWENQRKIKDLILELQAYEKQGYTQIKLEAFQSGNGTTEDGSYEYEFYDARIVLNK